MLSLEGTFNHSIPTLLSEEVGRDQALIIAPNSCEIITLILTRVTREFVDYELRRALA
jgi:hypothetical protein